MGDVVVAILGLARFLRLPMLKVFVLSVTFKLGRLFDIVASEKCCGLCFTVTRKMKLVLSDYFFKELSHGVGLFSL